MTTNSLDDFANSEVVVPLLNSADILTPQVRIPVEDGRYNDEAPATLTADVTYSGEVVAHRLCGEGTLKTDEGIFSGTFRDNLLEGEGCFDRRQTFEATASAPAAPNSGAATTSTSHLLAQLDVDHLDAATVVLYDGAWVAGVPQGFGSMQWSNGDRYSGLFDRGQPHGAGRSAEQPNTFQYADGCVYVGEFDHGVRDGRGKMTLPNGDTYEGQFVRGTATGFGMIFYTNGQRRYRGLLDHGRKLKGSLLFFGTQRGYDGEWQKEVPHGAGSMTFANGDYYKGDFAAGELQGVGCLYYQNPQGKVYYGQFLHGEPCGRGFLYEPPSTSFSENISGSLATGSCVTATEAALSDGYFQNGQMVTPTDTAVIEAVAQATCGLRQPEATAPDYATLMRAKPPTAVTVNLSTSFAFAPRMPPRSLQPPAPPQTAAPASSTEKRVEEPLKVVAPESTPTEEEEESAEEDDGGDIVVSEISEESDSELGTDGSSSAFAASPNGISSPSAMPPLAAASPDGSCRGWLEKCSIGRRSVRLISNWKKRFFILALCNDNVCLGYYEDELCRKPIGFIRLNPTDTRLVTCPTTKTHKKAKRPGRDLCLIYHESRREFKLLLRAHDAADHDRWVAAFRSHFHIVDRPTDCPMHASPQS